MELTYFIVVVASTIPFLAISYLTSPMVMWIHMPLPKGIPREAKRLEHYVRHAPPSTEVTMTTMGALGKPRVTKVPFQDLQHEKRRFGLVNYVRDVSKENAQRKWYQFRAVGDFKIEPQKPPKSKNEQPWLWYTLSKVYREQQRRKPSQLQSQVKEK